jgi:hypothetical protein
MAQTFVQVLKQCSDDLSRENIMKEAANLRHFRPPMLLPGIEINTDRFRADQADPDGAVRRPALAIVRAGDQRADPGLTLGGSPL